MSTWMGQSSGYPPYWGALVTALDDEMTKPLLTKITAGQRPLFMALPKPLTKWFRQQFEPRYSKLIDWRMLGIGCC